MTETTDSARAARRGRHDEILADVEADERANNLDVPLHLRIDKELDAQLRQRAASEHIPTSALVRRLLRQALHERQPGALSAAAVEPLPVA